jgi:hypothetical protein
MKINDLNKLIEETLYKEVRNTLLEEMSMNYEVYHIMCDGEPIATYETEQEAKEDLPQYQTKKELKGKELIIEKGKYESHEDMIKKLDEMGEKLETNENLKENKNMKKKSKLQEMFGDDLMGDDSTINVDVSNYDELDNAVSDLLSKSKNSDASDKAMEDMGIDDSEMDSDMDDEGMRSKLPSDDYGDVFVGGLGDEGDEEEGDDDQDLGATDELPMDDEDVDSSLDEEGMCVECGKMDETKSTCNECGNMLNEEGMCSECGVVKESHKKYLKLTESQLIDKIKKIINEAMKGEPGTPGVPGVTITKKSQKRSKTDNDSYLKDVEKKMKNYLSFEGNDNPEFPNQISKGDKMAIVNSEKEEEIKDMNFAGLQNLDYDLEPSEKFKDRMKKAIEGHTTMGNSPTTEKPTIQPSNEADKGAESKEKTGNVVNSKKAVTKLNKQIKNRTKEKEERVLYPKEKVPTKNLKEDVDVNKKVISEEVKRMKDLLGYNKKTQ